MSWSKIDWDKVEMAMDDETNIIHLPAPIWPENDSSLNERAKDARFNLRSQYRKSDYHRIVCLTIAGAILMLMVAITIKEIY